MREILSTVLTNLEYVGACMLLLALFRAADILFGIAIAKKNNITFDKTKFIHGIIYTVCALVGSAALVTGLSMAVPIIAYCKLLTDETLVETLKTFNVTAMCSTLIAIAIVTYGKDAVNKFKQFFGNGE
ncbi:MAG: hypothetical protein J1E39_01945 [Eubacterium sp.]|nr:hypothetical protein [Eubacterium sp.]